ncbi:class A beta-lactamase, subclass A2 [Chitinophaga cymbidii]|uniref:Beta-lactamase n=1 Tax=Chitinophaga cymbidii TaxID=1096750 RepID=A0A512RIS7_9BACT|nr:class A beta-lactamase, subclass A2 [Chitinophaga cymbidii]GEP95616.1 CepA family class A extended-spectrum beta-lactamase [Chitinophaga cymbidii]
MKLTAISAATLFLMAACNAPATRNNSADSTASEAPGLSDSLRNEIAAIAARSGGTVGVGIMNLHTRDTLNFQNDPVYPMQSVFKFPIAMAILHQVDEGKMKLEQKIYIDKKWMVPGTWSPLRDAFPDGNVDQTLAQLLEYMVSQSDNIACDLLIDLAGGEAAINDYVHGLGVKQIAIVASEAKMASAWDVQFTNFCAPSAMVQLLDILHKGSALSKTSNDFLWDIMLKTSTGPKRLKGLLPVGTPVAHKTGTSGVRDGVAAATNDAGIIVLPNGQKLAIVVYVMNARSDEATREATIAQIAKAAYDKVAQ